MALWLRVSCFVSSVFFHSGGPGSERDAQGLRGQAEGLSQGRGRRFVGTGGSATIAGRDSGRFHGMWGGICSMLWWWLGRWMCIRRSFWDGHGIGFVGDGWGMLLCRRTRFGLRGNVVRLLWGTWCGLGRHCRKGVVWGFSTRCECLSVLGHSIEPVIWVLRRRRTGVWWHSSVRGWRDCDSDVRLWQGLESEPFPSRWTVSFIGHPFVMLHCSRDLGSVGS